MFTMICFSTVLLLVRASAKLERERTTTSQPRIPEPSPQGQGGKRIRNPYQGSKQRKFVREVLEGLRDIRRVILEIIPLQKSKGKRRKTSEKLRKNRFSLFFDSFSLF